MMVVQTIVAVKGGAHHRALDRVLEQKVAKMEKICASIRRCRIVVERVVKTGGVSRFDVKILCKLDRKKQELTVKSKRCQHLSVAVSDAFKSLRGQLRHVAVRIGPAQVRRMRARREDKRDF